MKKVSLWFVRFMQSQNDHLIGAPFHKTALLRVEEN